MITTNLYTNTESHRIITRKGPYAVVEYNRDMSVSPEGAQQAYYASRMNVRKRQLLAETTDEDGVIVQARMMQILLGQVKASTNIKGAGDLMKKFMGSKVSGETTIKPYYIGDGTVVLEPTYNHILLVDLADWSGAIVLEDGMFLSCQDTADLRVTARDSLSSAVLGGEGLFNTTISGSGVLVMESPVPEDELFTVDMVDDEIKIDGNMAIAWSYGLKFTVERTTKTLIGSMASGEGLVNVYRGTGRLLIAPVQNNKGITYPKNTK